MGYPSVEMAISMLRDGSGFDVSEYDFKVADVITNIQRNVIMSNMAFFDQSRARVDNMKMGVEDK